MHERLKKEICRTVFESDQRVPVRDLTRTVSRRSGVDRSTVKDAIGELVRDEILAYTNLYGTSFLEASFDRPVRVSERIVITPPQKRRALRPEDVVIEMEKGAAFGEGAHPTTRLVLEAIDRALSLRGIPRGHATTALDVGTGTGILAIALAKLGVDNVLGTDIDPCAISEARHNVAINGLSERVVITDTPLDGLAGRYIAVLANLAFPTLKGMAPCLARLTAPDGVIVLSGFRRAALPSVRHTFRRHGLSLHGETFERNWACTTWRKDSVARLGGIDKEPALC